MICPKYPKAFRIWPGRWKQANGNSWRLKYVWITFLHIRVFLFFLYEIVVHIAFILLSSGSLVEYFGGFGDCYVVFRGRSNRKASFEGILRSSIVKGEMLSLLRRILQWITFVCFFVSLTFSICRGIFSCVYSLSE